MKSDEGIATIRAIAKRTAIPDDAWSIYLAPEPGFRSTLIDRTRPVQGGVIHRPGPFGGAYCSVGVNGEWQFSQSYRGFLTASHCTVAYLQLDASTTYTFQNSIITNDSLAYEFDDPTYFTGGSCAVGARCRYSDVAFFRYLNGSSSGLGTIARTMYSDSGAPGSTTISGQFTIAGDWPYSFLCEQLQKVGATTGWTYGSTIATCQNHLSQSGSPAYYILCSDDSKLWSDGGDSGAPIFKWYGSPDTTVYWAGILWGGPVVNNQIDRTVTWHSPRWNIDRELTGAYGWYW